MIAAFDYRDFCRANPGKPNRLLYTCLGLADSQSHYGSAPISTVWKMKESLNEGDIMAKSKIEWTENTWNPVTGCTKISDGCKNRYAAVMAQRLKLMGNKKYVNHRV